jgi:protein-tyrosine kinase
MSRGIGPWFTVPRRVHAPQSRRVELDLDGPIALAGIVTPNGAALPHGRPVPRHQAPTDRQRGGRGAATGEHGNLIMVTSALPGEGKSFTSINLAMSIAAELDHTVMLVDADVARPSVLRMLGLPPGPGFAGPAGRQGRLWPVCCCETNVDKLTILPSGSRRTQRATELLASDAMTHAAAGHGHALPRPHHHLRFAAPAADHRVACAGHAHGADRRGGAAPTARCKAR